MPLSTPPPPILVQGALSERCDGTARETFGILSNGSGHTGVQFTLKSIWRLAIHPTRKNGVRSEIIPLGSRELLVASELV